MKRFPSLLLVLLLLTIGEVSNLVAAERWGEAPKPHFSITLIRVSNAVAGKQDQLRFQQPGKGTAAVAANKQKLRRLRAQRDSLNQLIGTVEKQKSTSSNRKKLAKLQAERDLLANKIRQLLKSGGGQSSSKSSSKAASSKQGTTPGKKPASAKPATVPPKKSAAGKQGKKKDKIEQIISRLSDKEQRSAAANQPTTGPPRKPAATPQKKIAATPQPPAARNSEAPTVLRWPVDSRTVLIEYGERYNPQTNTVTLNPGINIRVDSDGEVRSAESGKVSMVTWMPSYRTVVIVDHGGGFRTVYANLSSAVVKRGSQLQRGDRIGTAGKSKEGRYLHFQLWKERQRMNPMTLLR